MGAEWPKKTKYELSGTKEGNWEKGQELGLSDEAKERFLWCCYALELEIEVCEDGSAEITHVQGVKLEKPVSVAGN